MTITTGKNLRGSLTLIKGKEIVWKKLPFLRPIIPKNPHTTSTALTHSQIINPSPFKPPRHPKSNFPLHAAPSLPPPLFSPAPTTQTLAAIHHSIRHQTSLPPLQPSQFSPPTIPIPPGPRTLPAPPLQFVRRHLPPPPARQSQIKRNSQDLGCIERAKKRILPVDQNVVLAWKNRTSLSQASNSSSNPELSSAIWIC